MGNITTRHEGAQGGALPLSDDLLYGAKAIAAFMFGEVADEKDAAANVRRAYHAADKLGLPTFRLGSTICARKSSILKWIEQQESGGRSPAAA